MKIVEKRPQWQVITVMPNGTKISTVELPSHCMHPWSHPFETCVFPEHGHSNVVGQYETKEEAIKAHTFLVQHELLNS